MKWAYAVAFKIFEIPSSACAAISQANFASRRGKIQSIRFNINDTSKIQKKTIKIPEIEAEPRPNMFILCL